MNNRATKWIFVGVLLVLSIIVVMLHTPAAYYLNDNTATIVVEDKYFVDNHNPPRYVRSEYPGWYTRWGGMRVDEQYIELVYGSPTYCITDMEGTEYVMGYDIFQKTSPRERYNLVEQGHSYRIKTYGWRSEIFGNYSNIVWMVEVETLKE